MRWWAAGEIIHFFPNLGRSVGFNWLMQTDSPFAARLSKGSPELSSSCFPSSCHRSILIAKATTTAPSKVSQRPSSSSRGSMNIVGTRESRVLWKVTAASRTATLRPSNYTLIHLNKHQPRFSNLARVAPSSSGAPLTLASPDGSVTAFSDCATPIFRFSPPKTRTPSVPGTTVEGALTAPGPYGVFDYTCSSRVCCHTSIRHTSATVSD